jgi:hypothetical protein
MAIQSEQSCRPRVLAVAVALALSGGAVQAADSDRIAELEKKLAQSLQQIDRLAARLNQMEAAKPAAGTDSATSARIEQLEQSLLQVSESAAKKNDLGLPLHGFVDVGYARVSRDDTQNANRNRRSGFSLGNVDFYLTPQLSDRVRALVEIAFEYGPDGALATDLERMQIAYQFNDAFTLWGGRFHTPYGYWNTAYHHGAQLQTSIQRPRFIAFEDQGGILQAHTVGALASGGLRLGSGKFQYDAWFGNGGITTADRTGTGDSSGGLEFNRMKNTGGNMMGANLRYAFGGDLSGLTLGVHGLRNQITNFQGGISGTEDSRTQMNMLGAFGMLERNDWEVLGEYYHFNNENKWVDNTSFTTAGPLGKHKSWAAFAQVGYTFHDRWTPYGRVEKAALNENDNYFASLNNVNRYQAGRSYNRTAFGLRYNVDPKSAIKAEILSGTEKRPAAVGGDYKSTEARLQYAIRF